MTTPWLTVITVVRDDPAGFTRTLRSLHAQDLRDVEFVVIDSSADRDGIPALLRASEVDGRVTWCEPEGIYPAMNRGLAEATGAYAIFLNAGDELAGPQVVAELRRVIESDSPVWLHGAVEIHGADGSVVVTPPWDFAREQEAAFSRGRFPAHQGTVARTEALRRSGGFDTSFRIAADYALALRLAAGSAPATTGIVIARFHEGGVSTTHWAAALVEFHRARREILHPAGAAARRERWHTAAGFARAAAYRSPWPLAGALALACVALMGLTGVVWGPALLLTALVGLQGLAGAIWWRLLRPGRSVPVIEAVGMGLGLGTAGAVLTGLLGAWWLIVVLAAVAWLIGRRWRGRRLAPLAPLARPHLLALAVGLVPGFAALILAFRAYPLAWTGLWSGYHGDMPFFEALATSVATLGPGSSIFMSGAELRYHSLAYGWAGELTMAAGAEPFVVLTRLLPIVMLIAATALAAAWAATLSRSRWAPSLAVLLVITGGFVGATYGSVLNFDSPSQTVSIVWLLALTIVVLQSIDRVGLVWHALAIAVLAFALTGGKVSSAAIAVAGIAALTLVALIRREPWRARTLGIAIAGFIGVACAYLLLLSGSANSGGLALLSFLDRASSVQGLNPVVTERGIAAGIVILVLAVLPRWAGMAWRIGDPSTRWAPATVFGAGAAFVGIATIVVLSGGFNDLWFAVSASAPLAVLSAVGTMAAAAWLGPAARTRMLLAVGCGLATAAIAAALWASGSTGIIGDGWRWAGPPAALLLALAVGIALAAGRRGRERRIAAGAFAVIALVAMAVPSRLVYAVAEPRARPQEGSMSTVLFSPQLDFIPIIDRVPLRGWTDTQARAGAFLRENAGSDDLIATNLTGHALVPALGQRRTYLSNTHIQAPYGRAADIAEVQRREAASWSFIDDPSAANFAPLCEAGVDWLWIDPRRTAARDWLPFATVSLEAEDAVILRVDPSAC